MHSAQTLLPDFVQSRQSNFYYSFLMLPKPKREAIETIYAFCRYTDDIVDEQSGRRERNARLKQWTRELHLSLRGDSRFQILNKLSTVIQRFDIPLHHFYDLIKGMEMDLTKKRYRSFEELREYCYKAASTVGLICAEVFGYSNEKTKQYAINLGIALQLTNILRDLKADAKRGRIYLPLEDLRRFRYTQQELLNGEYNDRFVQLMKFECERAREFFRKAKSYLAEEDKPLFTAARTMGNIYYLLLRRIEKANYDVFSTRIRLSPSLKMLVAMVLSLRSKAPRNLHQYIRAELPA